MTIEVLITNKDATKSIEVVAMEYRKGEPNAQPQLAQRIEPGCATTVHCHLLRDFTIREVNPSTG